MTTKTISAKSLRDNLRDIIIDINKNDSEYILEYIKGLKVKIVPIKKNVQSSNLSIYIKSRKWKESKDYKNLTNDEIRKLTYDRKF